MSAFSVAELAYLADQSLGRLATAGADSRPHVVPVTFRHNAELDCIDIGGHRFGARKKFRDVQANPWAALVVDDLASVDPWRPRMIEIRGRAEALYEGGTELGPGFAPELIRIRPTRIPRSAWTRRRSRPFRAMSERRSGSKSVRLLLQQPDTERDDEDRRDQSRDALRAHQQLGPR